MTGGRGIDRRRATLGLLAGSTAAALAPRPAQAAPTAETTLRLADFGGRADSDTPNDDALAALLRTVTDHGGTEANDRTPGVRILLDPGIYRFTRPIVIVGRSLSLVGQNSTIAFTPADRASPVAAFVELGDARWLEALDRGYYRVDLNGIVIDVRDTGAACAIRNRGMRSIAVCDCHVLGGDTGFESEGAFAALDLDAVVFQHQRRIGVDVRRRNNLASLRRVSVLGAGRTGVGFRFTSTGAELGAVVLALSDAEGCATGYRIAGDNIGNILLMNCWAEDCPIAVDVVNASRTNTYGIQLLGGQFDGLVRFGSPSDDGLLRGCGIGAGAKLSDAALEVNVPTGVTIGDIVLTGRARIVHGHNRAQPPQRLSPAGRMPSAQLLARYDIGHAVPATSSDTRGIAGDLRWDDGRLYLHTAEGWRSAALTHFEDATLSELPADATPDVAGLGTCVAIAGMPISALRGGHAGQRLTIVGGVLPRTFQAGAIRLPGNTALTLHDGDVLDLLCLGHGVWTCVTLNHR